MRLIDLNKNFFIGLSNVEKFPFVIAHNDTINRFCEKNDKLPAIVFLSFQDRNMCDYWAYNFLINLQQPSSIYSVSSLKLQRELEDTLKVTKVFYLQNIEYFLMAEQFKKENLSSLLELLLLVRDLGGVIFISIINPEIIIDFLKIFPKGTIETDFHIYTFTKKDIIDGSK